MPALARARVLAGDDGLSRIVQRVNVMEVPDILPWVKPYELLLTTGYPLRDTPDGLVRLVGDLAHRGLAAVLIKPGRYIDELPAAMLAEADGHGLPIVELPAEVGFDDILNQVLTEILNRQAAVLARSEEVHRALIHIVLEGGGLDEVAAELVGLVGDTVLVTTSDGQVLSRAGEEVGPPFDVAYFDANGRLLVEQLIGGGGALADDDRGVGLVPVVAAGLEHGRLAVISPSRPLDESDIHILERAAAVAALVITKQLAVSAVESKYQGDFLRDLLDGRAGDPDRAIAHSASLGWDIDRPLVVLVAEPDPTVNSDLPELRNVRPIHEQFAAVWRSVVHAWDPRAAVVGFSQEVVALLRAPADGKTRASVDQLVAKVRTDRASGKRSFSTGISRVVTSPRELPAAYAQARRAVQVGRQMHGSGAIAEFDELGTFRLLSLVSETGELLSFARDVLGDLAEQDDAGALDLRHTLEVLLECNLNVAETARKLHFHYNTLRYRIAKLEEILGPFTRDSGLRLNIQMALQALQMRGL